MERRLRALEQLARGEAGGGPGLDGLLDLLLGLHHELSSAPLRRERNVAQFLSWGEWPGLDPGGVVRGTPRRDPLPPPSRALRPQTLPQGAAPPRVPRAEPAPALTRATGPFGPSQLAAHLPLAQIHAHSFPPTEPGVCAQHTTYTDTHKLGPKYRPQTCAAESRQGLLAHMSYTS